MLVLSCHMFTYIHTYKWDWFFLVSENEKVLQIREKRLFRWKTIKLHFEAQVMLKWISDVIQKSFLRRDVKLKADSLAVVEVERVMHDGLWERYVRRRKSVLMRLGFQQQVGGSGSGSWHLRQLSQQANEHFAHSSTRCEILTDVLVPLPLSQAANEHWLFHGNLGRLWKFGGAKRINDD